MTVVLSSKCKTTYVTVNVEKGTTMFMNDRTFEEVLHHLKLYAHRKLTYKAAVVHKRLFV